MLKVNGRVMRGVLGLFPFTVQASTTDGQKESPAPPTLLSLDELSLYTAPPQPSPGAEERDTGELEKSVATMRKLAEPYTGWCQETYGKIQPKVHKVLQCGNDTYVYLKNPPKDFYPRAGVIGFTGVLGLLLARGSRLKKLLYPGALMTLSASLYYPERAASIARSAGDSVYERAVQGYATLEKMLSPKKKNEKVPESESKS